VEPSILAGDEVLAEDEGGNVERHHQACQQVDLGEAPYLARQLSVFFTGNTIYGAGRQIACMMVPQDVGLRQVRARMEVISYVLFVAVFPCTLGIASCSQCIHDYAGASLGCVYNLPSRGCPYSPYKLGGQGYMVES
jgi:hypothetical protein